MKKISFDQDWMCRRLHESKEGVRVTLPHDAMLAEKRSEENPGGGNVGWFEGHDYLYTKRFYVPEAYRDKKVIFEFEGVYRKAEVYLNGRKAAYRPYGYTNFYVDADAYLHYGEENEMRVIAHNADQPNSRWYTGSGIYRPVTMYIADRDYILPTGVKLHTVSLNPAKLAVEVKTSGAGEVSLEILDGEKCVMQTTLSTLGSVKKVLELPKAKLWSCRHPHLYTCKVRFGTDEAEETFGIRMLKWDSEKGLTINNKRVILKGACIHHDNGILGACAFPEAEERKIRLLMENGYNAVRSAHNPCSKAMLKACDRLGMLVMDEYVDVWYIHKTEYDYANTMEKWWQQDLKDMVEKDYNHPCVILYSTGNEVSETARKKGIELTGRMTRYLHKLDPFRPVTCGVNIFFNFLSSVGLGVYSDEKARKNAEKAAQKELDNRQGRKKKPVGSEFYNTLAGICGDRAMKLGATLYPCDLKTKGAYENMDIAGYNYGILRYAHDLKKYPGRLILGTETFCKDAYLFYEMAKKNPRIVGDFVWAGMDYIGEAAVGAWEYEDYAPKGADPAGWMTAGSGRLDLTGTPGGEAAYTKTAFGLTDRPNIAVRPVYQKGSHSRSAWKMTNAMPSWSWRGCSGNQAVVEVYARAAQVELLVNGRSVGRNYLKNSCNTTFHTAYQDGTLTAVAFDRDGHELGRSFLRTAGLQTILRVMPEKQETKAGELNFVRLRYTDEVQIWKPMEKHRVSVQVRGGSLTGLGNASPYNAEGYLRDNTFTYYGEALAAIRADRAGLVEVTVTDEEGRSSQAVWTAI